MERTSTDTRPRDLLLHWDRQVATIVQISPAHPDPMWRGCLLIVTEPKPWGVQGYIPIPGGEGEPGLAYLRVARGHYEVVGKASWMAGGAEDEDENEEESCRDSQ